MAKTKHRYRRIGPDERGGYPPSDEPVDLDRLLSNLPTGPALGRHGGRSANGGGASERPSVRSGEG